MEKIEKLCINIDKTDSDQFVTDFVDVSNYKTLRLSFFSTTKMTIFLTWSIDGKSPQIVHNYKGITKSWRSEKTEVIFPYLQVRALSEIGFTIIDFNLHFTGVYHSSARKMSIDRSLSIDQDLDLISTPPIPKLDFNEKRAKHSSPFKRLSGFNKKGKEVPMRDDRLPGLILDGQMLIVKDRKFTTISPGLPGDILQIDSHGNPNWEPADVFIKTFIN